jgi:uncharacterized protein YecT (DUF1311 family)
MSARSGLSVAFLAVLILSPAGLYAQEHLSYCDGIESTADMLKCVNRHRENAQIRLNMVFQELLKNLESREKKRLQETQKSWISYRNEQCSFEKKQAGKPGLERIYELSCLTNLTEQRTSKLSMMLYNENSDVSPEFGTFPRWMNVIAHEHPEIFWRYGQHISADMNCDGRLEQIITGLKLKEAGKPLEERPLDAVLAIAENPEAGKPHFKLLTFPVSAAGGNYKNVCSPFLEIKFKEAGKSGGSIEDPKSEKCESCLYIKSESCKTLRVRWTGNDYDVIKETAGYKSSE